MTKWIRRENEVTGFYGGMEKTSLTGCSSCSILKKGTDVTPNPSAWESLSDLCWDVYHCLNSNGPCGKRLIVHFSLPGTQIHIDIGNVKAAGVLCILGISFGIGTYVLYKIYDRYLRPSPRPKPDSSNSSSDAEDEEENVLQKNTGHEEMGNQQSSPVDIPVYYKAGFGVSLYKPVENSTKLRNRKPGAIINKAAEEILSGNVQQKNGQVTVENSSGEFQYVQGTRKKIVSNRAPDLSQLRIEIDESGFVDEEGAVDGNGEKLSNSLKGNFSPTSLCEKYLKLQYDLDLETDGFKSGIYDLNNAFINNNKAKDENLSVNNLSLGSYVHTSSVLLTPPPEDEPTSSHVIHSTSPQISRNSTKSDFSEIHSEIVDTLPSETDDEREQLSPLPYDRSTHTMPEKLCPRKLKIKLGEIISRSSSQSASTSGCTSPESSSNGHRRNGSLSYDVENSISGVSSPELELLNSENTDIPVVNSGMFVKLENEIHTVEDEFESISKEIQELTNKYRHQTDSGSEILKEIFLRYPSIRLRQSERGVYYNMSDNEGDSRNNSEINDEDRDLSWDLENVMDMVYSESSELESAAKSLQQRLSKVDEEEKSRRGSDLQSFDNTCSSVNCSVDLGGSMYEDEFHLHLGTKALPRIIEQSVENCDKHPCCHGAETSHHEVYDADCSSSVITDSSKQTSSENGQSCLVPEKVINNNQSYANYDKSHVLAPDCCNTGEFKSQYYNQDQSQGFPVSETKLEANCMCQVKNNSEKNADDAQNEAGSNGIQTGLEILDQTGRFGSKDFQRDQRSDIEADSPNFSNNFLSANLSSSIDGINSGTDSKDFEKDPHSASNSICHDVEEGLLSPVAVNMLCNIGDRRELTVYADSEWKGDTPCARRMREAYRALPNQCQCCNLRRIRGDNYCGVRGAVFQTLVNCLPPLNIWASKDAALTSLEAAFKNKSSGIHAWNFATRISHTPETKLEVMQRCLSTLYAKIEEMKQHSSYTEREQIVVHMLNSDPSCDLDLMEGVKLLMLLSAIRLRNDMEQGNDVPVFAWLMFARDTSETLSSFVRNHLNQVGDSGGLEQVEMCLLGYSLGVRIRVFRLKQFTEEDFVSFYPEDGTDSWPVVSLIAEDDRHYNVPVL